MRKYIMFCCCLFLCAAPVYADDYVLSGGNVQENIDVDNRTEINIRDEDITSTNNQDTDHSSSGGTHVELSREESRVATAKLDLWKYLKDKIMKEIPQEYAGSNPENVVFIGTDKLDDQDKASIKDKTSEFSEALEGDGTFPQNYNSNDLPPNHNRQQSASLTAAERREFKEKISELNHQETNGTGSGGSRPSNRPGNQPSGNTPSSGDTSNNTPEESGLTGDGQPSGSLPPGYGTPTVENGKVDLHNREEDGSAVGEEYKTVPSLDGFIPDIIKDGISDFEKWVERYKTLIKYYQEVHGSADGSTSGTVTNTALSDYDDIAYVTNYHITDKDTSYYTITNYTNYVKWELRNSAGNIVQSGEGEQNLADLHFAESGTYQFIVKQKVKMKKGTAVNYKEQKYLILIPTNTLLYFKETEAGPIILNETTEEKYITVSTRTFRVRDLNNESMNSNIERVE